MIIELFYLDNSHIIPDIPHEFKDFQALITGLSFKTNLPEKFTIFYKTSKQTEKVPIATQQDYQKLLSLDSTTKISMFIKDNTAQTKSLSSDYDIIDDEHQMLGFADLAKSISEIEILPRVQERGCFCSSDEQQQRIQKVVEEVLKERLPSIITQLKEAVVKELNSAIPKDKVVEEEKNEGRDISNQVQINFSDEDEKPQALFGHTITQVSKNKAVLFGGATGGPVNFSMTGESFVFDCVTQRWAKLRPSGSHPSQRAAHAATVVEENQLVIYGGSNGGGSMATDDLYLLDLRAGEENAHWILVPVSGATPGRRYGHSIVYSKPYLIVFGGVADNKSVNDTWVLNIQKAPFSWSKIECLGETPSPRLYHSAAVCSEGSANGMMVIFGGRTQSDSATNDTWGLRRRRNGSWDWVKAPYKPNSGTPVGRYQHSVVFRGSKMVIVGGRTQIAPEEIPIEAYDCNTSDWVRLNSTVKRFRHSSWIGDDCLYVHGGLDNSSPSIALDSLIRLDINNLMIGQ